MVQDGFSPSRPTIEEDSRLVSYLETIPDDIFINIASRLDLPSLMNLETNHEIRSRVNILGIPTYLIQHPLAHITLSPPAREWTPSSLVRWNHRISRQIVRRRWHAAQVGPAWSSAVIPVLELQEDRLLMGAGGRLIVHPLIPPQSHRQEYEDPPEDDGDDENGRKGGSRVIQKETVYNVTTKKDGSRGDIIGLAPLPDGQVIVAQFDGTIQRLSLGVGPNGGGIWRSTAHYATPSRTALAPNPVSTTTTTATSTSTSKVNKSAINTMSHDDGMFMITTSSPDPCALVYPARSPWVEPTHIELPGNEARAWSSLISSTNKYLPPTAMLGLSSKIAIYDLPTLNSTSGNTKTMRTLTGPDPPSRSSAYDLKLPPSYSSHHPSLLLSAWFDSHLRLHDLRSPSSEAVLEFSDPWIWADGSAMYSCAWFGEYGIAGGGARHGTVCLFDIRKGENRNTKSKPKSKSKSNVNVDVKATSPKSTGFGGWSVFSPGGKGSPVYQLRGEGGKLWGVTEKRGFVLSFDGSGEYPEGLLSQELVTTLEREGQKEQVVTQARDRGRGSWRGRGGRVALPVRRGDDEVMRLPGLKSTGYEHSHKSVDLFESLPLGYVA